MEFPAAKCDGLSSLYDNDDDDHDLRSLQDFWEIRRKMKRVEVKSQHPAQVCFYFNRFTDADG